MILTNLEKEISIEDGAFKGMSIEHYGDSIRLIGTGQEWHGNDGLIEQAKDFFKKQGYEIPFVFREGKSSIFVIDIQKQDISELLRKLERFSMKILLSATPPEITIKSVGH